MGDVKQTAVNHLFDATADLVKRDVKDTGAQYAGIDATNINATDRFVQFFDALADDVTLGSTAPSYVVTVPAGNATNRGGVLRDPPGYLVFKTALSYAVTDTPTGSAFTLVPLELTVFFR